MVGKIEWEATKKHWNDRCAICKKSEEEVGKFQQTHLKAKSKGGTTIIPMCRNCHGRFDNKELKDSELKRIGLTRENYTRVLPKKRGGAQKSPIKEAIERQNKATKGALRRYIKDIDTKLEY